MQPPAPFPPPEPSGTRHGSPARIAAALTRQLAQYGITRTYTAASELVAVISVTADLTVWTNGQLLWWDHGGERETWPAADTQAAAARLAALAARAHPE
jgi:hypothetical protein